MSQTGRGLSERTSIPIGLAVIAIGGAAIWLSSIQFQGSANASQLKDAFSKQDQIMIRVDHVLEEVQKIKEEQAGIRADLSQIKKTQR